MIWYLAIRHGAQPPDEHTLQQHFDWLRAQHERGTVLISGPSADRSMGLFVLRAPSRQAAADIAAEDPLAREEHVTIEIIEWNVHQLLGVGAFEVETASQRRG